CNPSAERILKLSRDQMVGNVELPGAWQIIREDGSPCPPEEYPYNVTLRTGQAIVNKIFGLRYSDDHITWISANTQPLLLPDENKPYAVVTSFSDITDNRHALQSMRESAAYWRYMSDLAFEGLGITENGHIMDANKRLLEILGYEHHEIIGMSVMDLVAPYDRDFVIAQISSASDEPYEHDSVRKDGSIIRTEVQGKTIENEGIRVRVTAIRDITQRRAMERELAKTRALLQAAIDQSSIGILIADAPDVKLRVVNDAAMKIRGDWDEVKRNPNLAFDRDRWQLFYPDGRPYTHEERSLARAARGETIHDEEMLVRQVHGGERWIAVNAAPVRNESQEIIASIAIFSDITERKQAETALRQREEAAHDFQDKLKKLHQVSLMLSNVATFDELCRMAVELGRSQLGFDRLGLWFRDLETGEQIGSFGTDESGNLRDERHLRLAPGSAMMELSLQQKQTIVFEDIGINDHLGREVGPGWGALSLLWDGDKVIGWISADNLLHQQQPSQPQFDLLELYGLTLGHLCSRKRAEEALRQSEARYRSLMESSPVAVIVVRIDDQNIPRIIYVNPAALTLFGADHSEALLGRTTLDFVVPEQRALLQQRTNIYAEGGQPEPTEFMIRSLHGDIRYTTGNSIAIEYEGQPAVLVVIADMTKHHEADAALRRSEERYRNLLELSPTAIMVNVIEADNSLRIVYVNPAAVRMYRAESGAELVGHYAHDFFVSSYQTLSSERVSTLLRGEIPGPAEYRERCLDNQEITTLVDSILIDYEGQPAFLSVISDITERKQAEDALRRGEERYRNLLEQSPVAIVVNIFAADDTLRVAYMNPSGLKLVGASRIEEVLGRTPLDFTAPSQHQQSRERTRAYQAGDDPGLAPYTMQRLDGSQRDVITGSIRIDYEGQPAILSVLTDVTERIRAETALRRSEERYRNLLESSPAAIMVNQIEEDKTLRVVYVNPAVVRLYGAENAAQVIGHYNNEFVTPAYQAQSRERMETLLKGEELPPIEYRLRRLDGSEVTALVGSILIEYDGQPAAASVFNDITERKRAEEALRLSEERLRLALKNTGTGIWEWDIKTNLTQWSEGMEAIFGLEAGVFDGTYEAYMQLVHPDDRDFVNQAFRYALKVPEPQYHVEYRILTPAGDIHWISVRSLAFRDETGWVIRMMGIIENITERKLAQLALEEREAVIDRQNQALIELAGLKALATGDLPAVLHEITRVTGQTIHATRVSVWFFNEDKSAIVCAMLYNAQIQGYEAGTMLQRQDYPTYFEAIHQNRVIAAHDAYTNPATHELARDYLLTHNIAALMDAPIRVGGRTVGVICHEHVGDSPRQWSLDDQHFAGGVADIVALAIETDERRRAQEALRQSEATALEFQEKLRTVHDITLALAQEKSLMDVCRLGVELGRSRLGFDRLGLWVLNQARDTILGTFGTDENGQLRDERHLSFPLEQIFPEILAVFERNERIISRDGGVINDGEYQIDSDGWNVVAILWNGSEGIGWLSADNYLSKAPERPYEVDLLVVYATALGSLITQRQAQETALAFQEKLRQVHEITLQLSQEKSLADMYRRAVELGRSELGFDRLGLWVLNEARDTILGTFGTDENGQLLDERHLSFPLEQIFPEVLAGFKRRERIISESVGFIALPGYKTDPDGWIVIAMLWNGREGVGWLSTDNYFLKASKRPYEQDLLTVYATALGSLITQRQAEETALAFQEKLRRVHEITLELSQVRTLTDMYRRAVELGRSELGFDRLGLWLIDKQQERVYGTFGTDESGQLRDETAYSYPMSKAKSVTELMARKQRTGFWADANINNHKLETVGKGWKAVTVLWNGSEGVGWLSTDSMVTRRPPRPYELDLLGIYGTSLGYLITQRQTEDALRQSEETALEFQEKLRTVHNIAIELSQEKSLTDIYRQAVQKGRSELGFDRLG
ncbi:MAG: PAS domain S-box protein, partial [Chloroflexi bacterium]|nr:PAS domain S-box protein [Chloroflexota bacterium]